MTSLVGKIGSGEVPQHELYPRKKISSWLPCVTKARPRNTTLGNGIRLWYSLVCVCGRLENPLQHRHPLLHYVANEKKGILYWRERFWMRTVCGGKHVLPCQRAISQWYTIHRNSVEKYNSCCGTSPDPILPTNDVIMKKRRQYSGLAARDY